MRIQCMAPFLAFCGIRDVPSFFAFGGVRFEERFQPS
jgi:hypothetical protein